MRFAYHKSVAIRTRTWIWMKRKRNLMRRMEWTTTKKNARSFYANHLVFHILSWKLAMLLWIWLPCDNAQYFKALKKKSLIYYARKVVKKLWEKWQIICEITTKSIILVWKWLGLIRNHSIERTWKLKKSN